jgi:hypothetical protein
VGLRLWKLWPQNSAAREVGYDDEAYRYAAEKFYESIRLTHAQQPFFLTTTGLMGIANDMVQEGDLIALLAGGNFPMIIQPDTQHYRLISPSYINGIMQGEAWPGDVPFENMERFTLI